MARRLKALNSGLIEFIGEQPLFFVATAGMEGRINLSPKGMDSLRVLSPNTILWLNLTGSGNETAAHVLKNPRITLMWCAFKGNPLILRAYGTAETHGEGNGFWEDHIHLFPTYAGSRQLVEMQIDLIQTSCGMGVPLMNYEGERDLLDPWASQLGVEGMHTYRQMKNTKSLDGYPTDISPEK